MKVSEGKRRLRLLISAVIPIIALAVALMSMADGAGIGIGLVVLLVGIVAGLAMFLTMTSVYWVMEGFRKDGQDRGSN